MNIGFFEVMKEEEDFLKKKLNGFSVSYFNETLSLVNAKKFRDLEGVSVFIYSTRKMNIAFDKMEKMDFSIDGLKGMDLKNKTLGVIGTGRIGANVIKIAKSFDMKIIAYDIYQNSELEKNMGFEYVKLPDLLKKSDIITLHTSYSKESHHMLDKKYEELLCLIFLTNQE